MQPARLLQIVSVLVMLGGSAHAAEVGAVTNLPLPRYVSLKASEGNARRGPSLRQRIDWVFKHRSMPLRVTDEFGNWRRVEDSEGLGGWVHHSLLSRVRTVVAAQERVDLRMQPKANALLVAHLAAGAIARLGECKDGWCRLSVQGHSGWAQAKDLWGVEAGD